MKQIAAAALVALALAGCGAQPIPLSAGRPAGPAAAAGYGAPSEMAIRAQVHIGLSTMIARFDRNDDGALDRAEAVVANVQLDEFARRDRDGDGVLTFAEFGEDLIPASVKGIKETAPKVVQRFDLDRDGRLSRVEYMAASLGFFEIAPGQPPTPDLALKGELFDLHAKDGKLDKGGLTWVIATAYGRGYGYGVVYTEEFGGLAERVVVGLTR